MQRGGEEMGQPTMTRKKGKELRSVCTNKEAWGKGEAKYEGKKRGKMCKATGEVK